MTLAFLCLGLLVLTVPGHCQTIFDMLMGGGGNTFGPSPFAAVRPPRAGRPGRARAARPDPAAIYAQRQAQLWNTEEHLAETLSESAATSPERKRVDKMIKQSGGRLTGDAAPLNYLIEEFYATTPGPTPPPLPPPRPANPAQTRRLTVPNAQLGGAGAAQAGFQGGMAQPMYPATGQGAMAPTRQGVGAGAMQPRRLQSRVAARPTNRQPVYPDMHQTGGPGARQSNRQPAARVRQPKRNRRPNRHQVGGTGAMQSPNMYPAGTGAVYPDMHQAGGQGAMQPDIYQAAAQAALQPNIYQAAAQAAMQPNTHQAGGGGAMQYNQHQTGAQAAIQPDLYQGGAQTGGRGAVRSNRHQASAQAAMQPDIYQAGGQGPAQPTVHNSDFGWQMKGQGFSQPSHVRRQQQASTQPQVPQPAPTQQTQHTQQIQQTQQPQRPSRFDRKGTMTKLQQLRQQLNGLAKKFGVPPLRTGGPKPTAPAAAGPNIAPDRLAVIQNQIGSLQKAQAPAVAQAAKPVVAQKKNPRVQGIEDQISALVKLRKKLLVEDKHQAVGPNPNPNPNPYPNPSPNPNPNRKPNPNTNPNPTKIRRKAAPAVKPGRRPGRRSRRKKTNANKKYVSPYHPHVMTRPPKPKATKPARRPARRRTPNRAAPHFQGPATAHVPMDPITTTPAGPTAKPPMLGDVRYMHGDKYVYTDADGFDTFQWIKAPPPAPAKGQGKGGGGGGGGGAGGGGHGHA